MPIRIRNGISEFTLDNRPMASYVEGIPVSANERSTMKGRTKAGDGGPKQRLLRAGEELFALLGYRRATIREICERANVNVAMVNYYFGGKQHLYRTVLERSMEESFQRHVSSSRPPSSAPPEERLRAFVVALLAHVLDKTDYNSTGRLMAREMVEPTFALDIVVDKIIRPWSAEAGSIARAFLGPKATDDEVFLFEQPVIVGQCLHRESPESGC